MATELTQIEVVRESPFVVPLAVDENPKAGDETTQEPSTDHSKSLQIITAGFSFFVAGVNDGSTGTMIPYVIQAYDINTAIASSIYGAAFVGWVLAAVSNTYLSQYLDLGAMLVLGCCLQILGSALRTWGAPFGVYVVTFFIISLGQAYQDTHANTFVAGAKTAHRWLGFIHAMYSGGCFVGPFVANSIASSRIPSQWNLFYIVTAGLGACNIALILVAFRDTVAIKRGMRTASTEGALEQNQEEGTRDQSPESGATSLIKGTLRLRSVWLLSLFYFFYLGAALTAGGWTVQYLVDVRGGNLAQMGYVPVGYNGGCFLGRLFLPELIHRFGDRRVVFLFCLLCLALQLCFWLIPNIIAASIAITFFGLFSGPFFPTGMALGKKLFPPKFHSTALAFVFVVAQSGGSLFPIIAGFLATRVGVQVLQPLLVGLIVATAISWLLVPNPKSLDNAALHSE